MNHGLTASSIQPSSTIASQLIPAGPMQILMTSSLEKRRDKVSILVATEVHTPSILVRNIDELLTLDKVGFNRGEFILVDHVATFGQPIHADDLIE